MPLNYFIFSLQGLMEELNGWPVSPLLEKDVDEKTILNLFVRLIIVFNTCSCPNYNRTFVDVIVKEKICRCFCLIYKKKLPTFKVNLFLFF